MLKPILFAALAAASLATPVFAQKSATRVVTSADLRLDRERDVRKLDRRIGLAVREACGEAADYDVRGKNEVSRCRKKAAASVAAERDRLVAIARAGSGTAVAAR